MRPRLVTFALPAFLACPLPGRLPDASEGRAAYERACASCHGVDARGHGPVAPALRIAPTDLTTLAARHGGTFPREEFIAVTTGERHVAAHGSREMPVWSVRFGPGIGGVPAAYAQRRLELLADYVAALQRMP